MRKKHKFILILFFLIIFISLYLVSTIFPLSSAGKKEILLIFARGSNWLGVENQLGKEIFLKDFRQSASHKMRVFAATVISGMPNCPFSGARGDVYVRNEDCSWRELELSGGLCKIADGCIFKDCCPSGCYRGESSCCPSVGVECGVLASSHGFASYCYNANTGNYINKRTYFCKIP